MFSFLAYDNLSSYTNNSDRHYVPISIRSHKRSFSTYPQRTILSSDKTDCIYTHKKELPYRINMLCLFFPWNLRICCISAFFTLYNFGLIPYILYPSILTTFSLHLIYLLKFRPLFPDVLFFRPLLHAKKEAPAVL